MSEQREKILVHASDLFLKDGLEGFSMRKLARRVGVTAPALYRHFESKEALVFAVLGEAYRRMARHLYAALEGQTPRDRLRLAGEGYVTFALEHPRLYDALFASPELVGIAELPPDVEAQGCAVGRFWNDRIRECMDVGILRRADPEAVGLTLWAHAHGLISLHARGLLMPGEDADSAAFMDIYRASIARLIEGLGVDVDEGNGHGEALESAAALPG
jgi:AcrR family transcriptional regulator